MRKLLFLLVFLLQSIALSAQVGIGTDHPDPSAVLELKGNGEQGLLLTRVYGCKNIQNPATGLIVYDTWRKAICLYNGTEWVKIEVVKISSVSTANKVRVDTLQSVK